MRRPRTNAFIGAVFVVLLSMVATVPIHAKLSMSFLHGGFIQRNFEAEIQTSFAEKCFHCNNLNDCRLGDHVISIPRAIVYPEWLWDVIVVFAATLEVLVRGFTLGFGIRMLKYLFWESNDGANIATFDEKEKSARFSKSLPTKALVSAVAGLSLAAFLHGASIVFPAHLREGWFSYNYPQDRTSTTLPLVLYRYIERTIVPGFSDADDASKCPSRCVGEICSGSYTEIFIDSTAYTYERIGTGLRFLATTLEVLLRGFSLGFGAMMLKFLFVPKSKSSESSPNDAVVVGQTEEEEWNDLVQTFRHRALVSSVAGISTAAFINGSSLFLPNQLRDSWLDYDSDDYWFEFFEDPTFWMLIVVLVMQLLLGTKKGIHLLQFFVLCMLGSMILARVMY